MIRYVPIHIAFNEFEPRNGCDKNLSPIIFLHGLAESKEMWDYIPQIISTRTGRKCYVLDARDHADSEWTEEFTFNILVEDVFYFMESKNIRKTIFIGHSMGGWTAYRVALRRPDMVEMLITVDVYVDQISERDFRMSQVFTYLWQNAVKHIPTELNVEEGIKFAVDFLYDSIPPDKQTLLTKKEVLYKCKFPIRRLEDGTYDINMKVEHFPTLNFETVSSPAEGVYKGPTYLIYGSLSLFFKRDKHEKSLRKHFPNIQLILFEEATHNLYHEFPEKFNGTVLDILLQRRKAKL